MGCVHVFTVRLLPVGRQGASGLAGKMALTLLRMELSPSGGKQACMVWVPWLSGLDVLFSAPSVFFFPLLSY